MNNGRVRIRLGVAGLIIGCMAAATGCGTSSQPAQTATAPGSSGASLEGTAWQLDTYRGASGTTAAAVPGASAALAFPDATRLTGSTGCNRFAGTYTQHGSSLSIALGQTTLVGCVGTLASQDAAVRTLLPEVTRVQISAGRLILGGAGTGDLLTYAAGLARLEGTSWVATGVNNGADAVVTTALTDHLTASFRPDGIFSGFGGCNTIAAAYATSPPHALRITHLATTAMACAADVDALENDYVAALGRVTNYEISGDELTLRDGGGAIQAAYRLAR